MKTMTLLALFLVMPAVGSGTDTDATAAERARGTSHDHLTDHNWQLEIEGVTQGAFAEVSGLDSETEVVLKEGIEFSRSFEAWLEKGNNAKPRTFQLIDAETKARYTLHGARPKSSSNGERVTMVVERIEKG